MKEIFPRVDQVVIPSLQVVLMEPSGLPADLQSFSYFVLSPNFTADICMVHICDLKEFIKSDA